MKESIKITEGFLNLLNRNLNTSIIPKITETLRECKTDMESHERNNRKS